MNSRNTIQVFEHQRLYYSETGPFREEHWKLLARYGDISGEAYYTVLGKGVKFSHFVGVLQAGNLTIEVLPKADARSVTNITGGAEREEKKLWHQVLLQMLKECKLLKVAPSNKAHLRFSGKSLLDIYLELFLVEVEGLLREGLVKKYQHIEGNQQALKGQLMFAQNIAKNSIHKERFFVRHTTYNSSNIFNLILYKTLLVIPKITNNTMLADRIARLRFAFPELEEHNFDQNSFQKLVFDRKTERYRDALMISKMILLHFHPDIARGNENVIAILFDMNKLWEEFVYRRLKKLERTYNIHVAAQESRTFWKPNGSAYHKKVRPDMIVSYVLGESKTSIILDTKWKMLSGLMPSDEDLKQMFVYNLLWKCSESVLIYPSDTTQTSAGEYNYERGYPVENRCTVKTTGVLNAYRNNLDPLFGDKLLIAILGTEVCQMLRK